MTSTSYQNRRLAHVEPDANRLIADDESREIEPKVMDLLMLFAGRPGEVIAQVRDRRDGLGRGERQR
jgi:DNA-binding winged helix-turn-helix (wHTH) protein